MKKKSVKRKNSKRRISVKKEKKESFLKSLLVILIVILSLTIVTYSSRVYFSPDNNLSGELGSVGVISSEKIEQETVGSISETVGIGFSDDESYARTIYYLIIFVLLIMIFLVIYLLIDASKQRHGISRKRL